MICHIFFGLAGVLVNPGEILKTYPQYVGEVMAPRFGGTAVQWERAYREVARDWDNYWLDLNLAGDEPLEDFWEGLFRITRALFRISRMPTPPKAELIQFSRVLPELVCSRFDALYPGTKALLHDLHRTGFCLHAVSYWTTGSTRAALVAGGVAECFGDRIFGIDETGRFEHDFLYLARKADVRPEHCLVVDRDKTARENARAAGMRAISPDDNHLLKDMLAYFMVARL